MLHVGVCSWIRIASNGKVWVSAVTVLAECSAVSLHPSSKIWWLLIRDSCFCNGIARLQVLPYQLLLNCTFNAVPALCQPGAPNSCSKSLWIVWGSVENQLECLRNDSFHTSSLWLLSVILAAECCFDGKIIIAASLLVPLCVRGPLEENSEVFVGCFAKGWSNWGEKVLQNQQIWALKGSRKQLFILAVMREAGVLDGWAVVN